MRRLLTGVLLVLFFTVEWGSSGANAQPPLTESNVRKRVYGERTVQSERDEQEALFNYYFGERNLKYETT